MATIDCGPVSLFNTQRLASKNTTTACRAKVKFTARQFGGGDECWETIENRGKSLLCRQFQIKTGVLFKISLRSSTSV